VSRATDVRISQNVGDCIPQPHGSSQGNQKEKPPSHEGALPSRASAPLRSRRGDVAPVQFRACGNQLILKRASASRPSDRSD